MSYRLHIELPGLPETTNQILAMALRKRIRRKIYWKSLVGYLTAGKRPLKPIKRAKLTLTRHSAGKCDYDGRVSSFKHVIDGLVEAGILENDTEENVGKPSYEHAPAPPGKGFCTITLEELT